MNIVLGVIFTLYLCLGIVAGCYLLVYRYLDLEYEANNTKDKEKYHKLKIKAFWITALGYFMISMPVIVAILIII